MKAKIIYFVLYLVVLAELLVVIHERDQLVEGLELEKYIKMFFQPIAVGKPEIARNKINIGEPIPNYISLFPVNLTSDKEKEAVEFFGDLADESRRLYGDNYLPNEISTLSADTAGRAFIRKDRGNFTLTLKINYNTLSPSVQGMLRTPGSTALIKYDIYCRSPKILPDEVPIKSIYGIVNRLVKFNDKDDMDAKIKKEFENFYGKMSDADMRAKMKQVAVKVMLGLEDKKLLELIKKNPFTEDYGLNSEDVGYLKGETDKVTDTNDGSEQLKIFKKNVIERFKGKIGFVSAEDFYYFESGRQLIEIPIYLFQ